MKLIALFAIMALSLMSYSQKKAKIKFKQKNNKVIYNFLPEIPGLENHLTFSFSLKEGEMVYPIKLNAATKIKGAISATNLIPGKVHKGEGSSLAINVEILSSTPKERTVISHTEKRGEKDVVLYNYNFAVEQLTKISIIDVKNGNKVLTVDTITSMSQYQFPRHFKGKTGAVNKQYLKTNYDNFKIESKTFNEDKKRITAQYSVKNDIKKRVAELIKPRFKNSDWLLYHAPKTKDSRFVDVDTALVHFRSGFDQLKENRANKIFINGHEEKAFNIFSKTYEELVVFTLEKCIETAGNEADGKKLHNSLAIPLLTSAIYSSRYDEALEIFKSRSTSADLETKTLNQIQSSGIMKESYEILFSILVEEYHNFEENNVKFNFYK